MICGFRDSYRLLSALIKPHPHQSLYIAPSGFHFPVFDTLCTVYCVLCTYCVSCYSEIKSCGRTDELHLIVKYIQFFRSLFYASSLREQMPMVKPSWLWNNDKKVQECIRTGQTSYSLNLLNCFIFYTVCNTAFDDAKDGSQLRY